METVIINQIVWRGSYCIGAIFLLFVIKRLIEGKFFRMLVWTVILGLFVWTRFVEPYQLEIHEVNADIGVGSSIALIADLHLGVYKDEEYFAKVVQQINTLENIDMVFIVGDFLYNLTEKQSLPELFAPLRDLERPVYAVLGNHDVGVPGDPNLKLPLIQVLEYYGVTVLQNDIIRVDDFYLVGLGPLLNGEADTSILSRIDSEEDVVVLTHNPDTTMTFPNRRADLTLAGHTHCGQIRPPLLYNTLRPHIVPVEGDFDCGLTQEQNTKLYITPGIGEVFLPMRFLNPPTISLIHF